MTEQGPDVRLTSESDSPEPFAVEPGSPTQLERLTCREHFAAHPTRPELVAVCTLPSGHQGEHDNVLPKPTGVSMPAADTGSGLRARIEALANEFDGAALGTDFFGNALSGWVPVARLRAALADTSEAD